MAKAYLAEHIEIALNAPPTPEYLERITAKVRRAIADLKSNPQAYASEHPMPANASGRVGEMGRLESALAKLENR